MLNRGKNHGKPNNIRVVQQPALHRANLCEFTTIFGVGWSDLNPKCAGQFSMQVELACSNPTQPAYIYRNGCFYMVRLPMPKQPLLNPTPCSFAFTFHFLSLWDHIAAASSPKNHPLFFSKWCIYLSLLLSVGIKGGIVLTSSQWIFPAGSGQSLLSWDLHGGVETYTSLQTFYAFFFFFGIKKIHIFYIIFYV